jgi:uncharacterized protein with ParB-like and HNH nuclease domain
VEPRARDSQHFLGAVVFETKPPIAGDVTRHEVIDGQQRMTTLQLLLYAVHEVVYARGHEFHAASCPSRSTAWLLLVLAR